MVFHCPICASALVPVASESLLCSRCERSFPKLGGVWCLVRDPEAWASVWQRRSNVYAELAEHHIRALQRELRETGRPARTRQRIAAISSGLEEQRGEILEHMKRLNESADVASKPTIPWALPSGSSPVLKCYENLFRDWSWGEAEAAQSLELVRSLAPASLGTLGVYGAGAGRLAVDVHTALAPEQTVALDLNPFPLLVAARLVRGEAVSLPEFPVGPHTERDVVVRQTLRCSSPLTPSFSSAFDFVFADALRPPFARGSLDSVLTSWVIDALDADLEQTVRSFNHVLRSGGTWINIGPLRFDGGSAAAYSLDEVLELVQAHGFQLVRQFSHVVDYFHSPHSGSHRRETVFCFAARKVAGIAEAPSPGVRAAWLMDPHQPIVMTPSASALRRNSVFTVGVLSLVDGKRSLADIAATLAEQWRVPPETLIDSLRELFAQLAGS